MPNSILTHLRSRPRLWRLLAAGAFLAVAGSVGGIVWWARQPAETRSVHDVPLGVEEAVVIRYTGPRLIARPYRRGASINLRIAGVTELAEGRVYDVRYVVNLPGEFALTDDLPTFAVRGLTSLSKDLETRIQEIEDVGIHIWHWYYETLAGLGVFWILWLLGLIFLGRRWRAAPRETTLPELSLAEQIAQCLAAIAAGDHSVARRSQLEILLLKCWRERLGLQTVRMAEACRRMHQSAALGETYRRLIAWLHHPGRPLTVDDLLPDLRPFGHDGGAPPRTSASP
jgi:hypothetical protein